ncbi:MAG: MFS transporter [Verrucomicrobia bacterium]|nr:MFS transporter [Verrucomicrobiota bacterium]
MFGATALNFLDRQVLSVLAPQLMAELDMSNTTYSRVVSAFVFSYTIMFTAGGWLVDFLGTRRGLAFSVGVWSLASAAHSFVTGPWGLGAVRMLLGFGEGACFPAATKGACEWFPVEKRALAIGIANGGSAFGAVLAPPLTAWLAVKFGGRGAFLGTGLLGFVWVIAWAAAARFGPIPRAAADKSPRIATDWRGLLGQPVVWRILAARFLFDPVFYFYMFWIPQYLSRERGFSLEEIGKFYWIPFLVLGVSNIGSGQLSDFLVRRGWTTRQARSRLLLAAALLTPVSCLVVFAHTAGGAIVLMSCLLAAHGLWICNFLAHISDHLPASSIATVVGMSGTVGGCAGMLANLAVGPVVDHYSFTPVFITSAVLYPLAAMILLARRRHN